MQGVRSTNPEYDKFAPKWKRVRDVVAGQDAVQNAGEQYLPRLKDEDNQSYVRRVKRSDFFNATWRTMDALNGMAFRKPPVVNLPQTLEPYLLDVTLSGVSMFDFAKETTEEVLGPGRVGILVDHPPQPGDETALTVGAAQKMGLRPMMQLYCAEAIRNWKFGRVNNAWVLTQVVLSETKLQPKDEFSNETVTQYRVLDLGGAGGTYRQRIFEVHDEKDIQIGADIVPLMKGKPLDYIPFAIVGAGGKGDCIDEPPLIDLVDKNLAHYQVNADYRHALHFCGLPTLFLAGITAQDGEKFYVGGEAAIFATDPHATGSFIEMKGEALKPVEAALTRLEQHMAILGARMIADESKQIETLGATQIKRQGENSVLAKIVQSVSEALEWSLKIFAEWAGQSVTTVKYQINRDFMPAMMDGRELMGLVQALQAGGLSNREFFELMQRGDVIDGDRTFEQHQEELKADPPGGVPAPAPKPGGMV